ncbi:chryseobasin-related MNIO class RiPP peptide [Chitinophaga sancti]|uniref:Lipoprotein n=1 Tax=Chitinophaga sancti TaxID=1004 RepID=A0A1K1QXW6_9BACT|nr:hypothetical protein [Chitinophaga sancti]WQD62068.1 hypothetical protein U0033_29705 [Chitinophaga sancti]WQG92363.1 hypothetical protein SR876_12680 [Chitinophaga sancti]SFW64751.1 hypothetical protein SAMN05661012_03205 [Chitinophaga sancti]
MKLSKSLLSAIMIGIAVQTTVVSCSKDEQVKPKKADQANKQSESKPVDNPDSCPACGMG